MNREPTGRLALLARSGIPWVVLVGSGPVLAPGHDSGDPGGSARAVWRAHYARVERELRTHVPSDLAPGPSERRSALIEALAAYRERGDFTRLHRELPGLVPRFVDDADRRCAVAELLHASGRGDLVAAVRARANDAWIADLAGDPEFRGWLDRNGLTLEEAARIQTPAYGDYRGPADTAPPGGDPVPVPGPGLEGTRKSSGAGPGPRNSGTVLPSIASPGASSAASTPPLDAWWVWWEFNKLAYLAPRGLEQRLVADQGRRPAELASLTDPLRRVREPLFLAALSDPDALVRAAAALSLGRLAGPRAAEPLARLLVDPSQRVREHALFGLGASGSSEGAGILLDLLEHGGCRAAEEELVSPRAVPLAILALAVGRRAGMDPAVAQAVVLFARRTNDTSESARSEALRACCLHQRLAPHPALEALAIELIADQDASQRVRAAAIEALGGSADPKILARLQGLLLGRDLELRRSAALALGRSPQGLATSSLLTAYELESEPVARGFALLSIGLRGGPAARDLLLEELAGGPLAVEPWAALGLGLHARSSNEPAIRAALLARTERAQNEDSRPALLIALGLAREGRAVPIARRALESAESARERGYAATALALLGGSDNRDFLRARLALERSGFVRATIAQALSVLGDGTDASGLFQALTRLADPELRAVTAASLGLLGVPTALPGLDELARATTPSSLVRATALDGLGVLLERGEPLILPELSQGANYAVYEDWAFDLFQLTL